MNKQEYFLQKRKEHFNNFNLDLKKRRDKFINWLLTKNWNPTIKVFEMYPYENDVLKNEPRIPQYKKEYVFCNTRLKTHSETRAEIDNLPFDKTIRIITDICLELMKYKYHFAVFYAEGQRSPHIIIYDFEELKDFTPFQREKAQLEFWRSIVPFQFQYLDKSIWGDLHTVPLEFTPHWKYGTPFNLLFEYIPEVKKCKG